MRWEKVRQMKQQAELPRYEAAAKDSWTSVMVISAAMEARDAAERARRVAREAANAPRRSSQCTPHLHKETSYRCLACIQLVKP